MTPLAWLRERPLWAGRGLLGSPSHLLPPYPQPLSNHRHVHLQGNLCFTVIPRKTSLSVCLTMFSSLDLNRHLLCLRRHPQQCQRRPFGIMASTDGSWEWQLLR